MVKRCALFYYGLDHIHNFCEQPCQKEVDDRREDQRSECLIGCGADDIARFREVLNGDVADDRGCLDQSDDLGLVTRKGENGSPAEE